MSHQQVRKDLNMDNRIRILRIHYSLRTREGVRREGRWISCNLPQPQALTLYNFVLRPCRRSCFNLAGG